MFKTGDIIECKLSGIAYFKIIGYHLSDYTLEVISWYDIYGTVYPDGYIINRAIFLINDCSTKINELTKLLYL